MHRLDYAANLANATLQAVDITYDQEAVLRAQILTMMVCALLCLCPGVFADPESSQEADAIQLLQLAQQYLQTHGVEASIVEFNRLDSPFNVKSAINPYGDMYLFTLDSKGYQRVHGKNPKIRNKVMLEMRDIDGVYLISLMVEACFNSKDGKGWVEYRWPHPITKTVQKKRGYVEKVKDADFCIGTGIYL